MDRAGRAVGRPLRPEERAQEPLPLVRDRVAPELRPEDDGEPEVGRVEGLQEVAALERAAERREQAELVEAPEACGRQALELGEDPLARRPRSEVGVRADELLRQRREPEAELVLQADGAQEAERVVLEDRLRDRAQATQVDVLEAAARVDDLAAGEWPRERVHREVPRREVALDRPAERREVDRAAIRERDAPGAVPLREGERRAAGAIRVGAGGLLGLAAGDVEVDDRAAEELVPERSADDPRLLAGEELARELIHRRPSAGHVWERCSRRTRSRS